MPAAEVAALVDAVRRRRLRGRDQQPAERQSERDCAAALFHLAATIPPFGVDVGSIAGLSGCRGTRSRVPSGFRAVTVLTPVPQADAVVAVASAVRVLAGREDHEAAARRDDHMRPALRARTVFHQHELAAVVVGAALRQDGQHLEGEEHVAVEILVQRVPVALGVAKDQRRRALLARRAAPGDQVRVLFREPVGLSPLSRSDQRFAIGASRR